MSTKISFLNPEQQLCGVAHHSGMSFYEGIYVCLNGSLLFAGRHVYMRPVTRITLENFPYLKRPQCIAYEKGFSIAVGKLISNSERSRLLPVNINQELRYKLVSTNDDLAFKDERIIFKLAEEFDFSALAWAENNLFTTVWLLRPADQITININIQMPESLPDLRWKDLGFAFLGRDVEFNGQSWNLPKKVSLYGYRLTSEYLHFGLSAYDFARKRKVGILVSDYPIKVKHEGADMTLDPGVWYVAYIPQSQVDN